MFFFELELRCLDLESQAAADESVFVGAGRSEMARLGVVKLASCKSLMKFATQQCMLALHALRILLS